MRLGISLRVPTPNVVILIIGIMVIHLVFPLARGMLLRVTTHDAVLLTVIMAMLLGLATLYVVATSKGGRQGVPPTGSLAQSEY